MPLRTHVLVLALAAASTGCFVDGSSSGDSGAEAGSTSDAPDGTSTGGPHAEISASATASLDTVGTEGGESTAGEEDRSSSSTGPGPGTGGDTEADTEGETDADDGTSTGAAVLTVEELAIGDLVITEMMGNPNCHADDCEWFEVLNTTDLPIDLFGLGIGDRDAIEFEARDATVGLHVVLEPGELGVFARAGLWPYEGAVEPLVRYPNAVALSNGEYDTIGLFGTGDILLDEAATFLGDNENDGHSRKLRAPFWNAIDNDDSEHWCWSSTPLPSTSLQDDWGTPGFDAEDCDADGL